MALLSSPSCLSFSSQRPRNLKLRYPPTAGNTKMDRNNSIFQEMHNNALDHPSAEKGEFFVQFLQSQQDPLTKVPERAEYDTFRTTFFHDPAHNTLLRSANEDAPMTYLDFDLENERSWGGTTRGFTMSREPRFPRGLSHARLPACLPACLSACLPTRARACVCLSGRLCVLVRVHMCVRACVCV